VDNRGRMRWSLARGLGGIERAALDCGRTSGMERARKPVGVGPRARRDRANAGTQAGRRRWTAAWVGGGVERVRARKPGGSAALASGPAATRHLARNSAAGGRPGKVLGDGQLGGGRRSQQRQVEVRRGARRRAGRWLVTESAAAGGKPGEVLGGGRVVGRRRSQRPRGLAEARSQERTVCDTLRENELGNTQCIAQ